MISYSAIVMSSALPIALITRGLFQDMAWQKSGEDLIGN